MLAISLGLVIVSPLSRESTVGILDPTVFREERDRQTDRQAEPDRQRDRERILATENDEVSKWDRKKAAKLASL